ncbi:ANTAR domain-containing protein [Streptomyces formicae]|uniref:ANTAR domain-containing protein n=1 Tax=Streptomyces formicae TaxID=1616117 RepID=UPI001F59FDB4|nr:ANTAR domain-containing protein [Streptomyces formicae]
MTTSDRGRDAPGHDQLAAAVTQLTAELAALRRDLARRHLLDLASGVLVAQLSLTPADAVDHLAQLAETTGIAPEDLAADIVNGASGTAGLSPRAMAADVGDAADDGATAEDAAADVDVDVEVDQERADARRARLTEAAAEAAAKTGGTVDEVAETLLDGGLRPLGVRGLWLFRRTETDCLELAGQAGVSPLEAAHWRWVPPAAHSPLHRVLTEAAPAWLPAGPGNGERLPGPAPEAARAVLPLRQRGLVTGLALADWPGPASWTSRCSAP